MGAGYMDEGIALNAKSLGFLLNQPSPSFITALSVGKIMQTFPGTEDGIKEALTINGTDWYSVIFPYGAPTKLTKQLTQTYPATTSGLNILDVLKGTTPASALKVNFNKSATINPEQQGFLGAVGDPNKFRAAIADGKLDDTERAELGFTDEEIIQFAGILKSIGLESAVEPAKARLEQQKDGQVRGMYNSINHRVETGLRKSFSRSTATAMLGEVAEMKRLAGTMSPGPAQDEYNRLADSLNNTLNGLIQQETDRPFTEEVTKEFDKAFNGGQGTRNRLDALAWLKGRARDERFMKNPQFRDKLTELMSSEADGQFNTKLNSMLYQFDPKTRKDSVFRNQDGNWDFSNDQFDVNYLDKLIGDLESNYYQSDVPGISVSKSQDYVKFLEGLKYWRNVKAKEGSDRQASNKGKIWTTNTQGGKGSFINPFTGKKF
jgi:hypothetical protein